MAIDDLRAVRKRWVEDEPRYRRYGEDLSQTVLGLAQERGLTIVAHGTRTKDPDEFLRKIIRKGYNDYDDVSDKVGLRFVLPLRRDADSLCAAVEENFPCTKDDAQNRLGADKIGYSSIHLQIRCEVGEFSGLEAELQVRSVMQDAWASIAHELTYKPGFKVPSGVERRVNLIAAVCELSDGELESVYDDVFSNPELPIGKVSEALGRIFVKLTGVRYDRELTQTAVTALIPAYGKASAEEIIAKIQGWVAVKAESLSTVFEGAKTDEERSPFLFQPEALLVGERAEARSPALAAAWAAEWSPDELDHLAGHFGLSVAGV